MHWRNVRACLHALRADRRHLRCNRYTGLSVYLSQEFKGSETDEQGADVNNIMPIRPIEDDADVASTTAVMMMMMRSCGICINYFCTSIWLCVCLVLKSEQGVTRSIYYFWGVGAQSAICLRWCINTLARQCIMQTHTYTTVWKQSGSMRLLTVNQTFCW